MVEKSFDYFFNRPVYFLRSKTWLQVQFINTEQRFSNNVSEFTHSNCITLSYYSSPKLVILTESFSPLKSVLHNLSCWSPKKWHSKAMLSLILSTWHACWASSHWFNLVPTNLNCQCKACYMPSGKFHCCLVILLIDKLDTDAMYQMPMMESSIVTAKIPFVLWTNTNVILSH